MRTALLLLTVTLAAVPAGAQGPSAYLDVFVVKVKPEKRADFDAVVKKMVDANRRHNGDTWLTSEVSWGESNTVLFSSARASFADTEKAMEMFMGAVTKALGPAAGKLLQDFNSCVTSSRAELRRRRVDLSSNVPSDANKMVGESRWLRTFTVRVRPGRTLDYEALLRDSKAAREKSSDRSPVLVSQSLVGQVGTVFYITTLKSSLAGFDSTLPLDQVLGPAGYQKYLKASADIILGSESMITRFVPELSNPPAEIAAVAPDFWKAKPPPPPPPPPKKATGGAAKK
jgi:hypothetical protein